jgi:hypothetical protein
MAFMLGAFRFPTMSNYSSPLDHSEDDGNEGNNKENVNDASGAVSEKSDGPGDNQYDRDDVK